MPYDKGIQSKLLYFLKSVLQESVYEYVKD